MFEFSFDSQTLVTTDADGKHAMETDGYFYFGAAKDLPGIREMFEKRGQCAPRPPFPLIFAFQSSKRSSRLVANCS